MQSQSNTSADASTYASSSADASSNANTSATLLRQKSIYKLGELVTELRMTGKKETDEYKLVLSIFDERLNSLKKQDENTKFARYD